MRIELEGVTRRFGSRLALDIDRLVIGSGEVICLSGANGSGKTTLLRALAGLDPACEGTILYDGKPLNRDLARMIGYVHQQPVALRRSVFHNLEFPLAVRGIGRSERKKQVSLELERFELNSLAAKRADRLSGGEVQKMALARALLATPKLLLLDEPTAALDRQAAALVLDRLAAFQRESEVTMIIVSHQPLAVTRFCERHLVMDYGRIR
ncbi:MAG TPA: ABC transporter ATP-binding protein [Clostridiaceae bacterium]|nr:ABC transporter ATP-binding protein [Clostridiaceae bacterium]